MFITNFLKLKNVKELFLQDQLKLLNTVIRASLVRFPFQFTSSIGAESVYKRKPGTFKDLMISALKGEGGHCAKLNGFMKFQLQCLGFDAHLISGSFRRSYIPDTHCVIIVKIPGRALKRPYDRDQDKSFLVDLACCLPLHEAICIEDLEHTPFRRRGGGLDYRYEKIGDNSIRRVNECGDAVAGKRESSYLSPQDCSFSLEPKIFEDFHEPHTRLFSDPLSHPMHQSLYLFRYLDIQKDDFKCVCIDGTKLIYITKETRETQKFASYQEIKPYILDIFPMIQPHLVEHAVQVYSIPFEEALKAQSIG